METQERLRRIDPARLTAFQAELLRKEYSVGTAENYLRAVRAFASQPNTPPPPSTPCWQVSTAFSPLWAGRNVK